MPKAIPEYIDQNGIHHPDTCNHIVRSVKAGKVLFRGMGHGHYPGQTLPRGVMPELKTVGFFDARKDQDWGTDWHYNEGIEVSLVENGHVTFCVDAAQYHLQPNDLTVTRPWQRHRLGNPFVAATRFHWFMVDLAVRRPRQAWRWPPWIVLTAADRKELTRRLRELVRPILRADEATIRCFRRIAAVVDTDGSRDRASLLAVLINEAFILLLEALRNATAESPAPTETGEEIVQRFWDDLCHDADRLAHPWQLPEMARQCGLGVTRFVDLTRHVTNLPPMRFLRQCRLRTGARLLAERPQHTITEIALACGFSSGQHFANSFRCHFDMSPQVWRCSQDSSRIDRRS